MTVPTCEHCEAAARMWGEAKADRDALLEAAKKVLEADHGCGCCGDGSGSSALEELGATIRAVEEA